MLSFVPYKPVVWVTLAAAFLLGGCRTVAPGVAPAPAVVAAAPESFGEDLRDARLRAWQTVLDLTRVYAQIPAGQCPGVSAWVKDIDAARRRIASGEGPRLDELDVDALVTRNANFWRASLEIAPTDGSLLLLQAMLFASAGEVWRANRVLMATTQLLPIDARTRPLYLAHTYGLGALILDSIEGIDARTAGAELTQVEAVYENALAVWPGNALVLSALIELRARAARGSPGRDGGRVLTEESARRRTAALESSREEIDRLHALDPINAASFRGDAAARLAGQKLLANWQRLSDRGVALGHKEISEIVQELEQADAPELALTLQRLLVVARGFASPGDAITWRRLLPKLLDPAEADALLTAWSEGTITTVALSGPEPEELEWTGDVATNPILRHQLDRELGERDFRIDMLRSQPVALAQAYRERGQLHGRAGRHEAALADFAAAARLPHRDPVLGMARAVVLGDLQRDEEAEAAFKEILRTRPDRERAELALGAFRFGQGRYEEARTHFRTEAQRDPATGRPAILADLSARRAGGTERRLVAKALEQVSPDSWDAHCLGYLQGGINEENLLRRAREGGELTVASQLSEAYFLLAQTSLASGDQASAVAHLESCISTGMTGMIEFRLARLELRRLAPDREARLRGATESTATPPRTPAAAKEAGEGSEDAASAGSTPA
jgi:lipoprotein NlpI